MQKQWCYFLFLAWFSYLSITSILLFKHGFLLSRDTKPNNSSCISLREVPCLEENGVLGENFSRGEFKQCTIEENVASILNNVRSASFICLPQRAKVVWLDPLPYQNKMPEIHDLLSKYPDRTRLFQFIADPPTTTMQRLKALTTGSLPTFIDAGSNFATSEINEDNIIDQLVGENRDVIFMGDDTWTGLYPNRFKRAYPLPSFNVWDLDTVDSYVKIHLFTELDNSDWNMLIAHFLGVDHCGHRYGPNHAEMERKLGEMNDVIRKVAKDLEDDTILIVIGDHGMTNTGDHGGESSDEVKAAMFVYSKMPLITMPHKENSDIVKQVDLVPTLANILGVPIPYSNLGVTILDSLPVQNVSAEALSDNWKMALYSLWANLEQLYTYVKKYAQESDTFSPEKLEGFKEKYNLLSARVHTITSVSDFLQFVEDAKDFMVALRGMCEEAWIQFDSFSMSRGLLMKFLVMFFVYMIVDGIPIDRLPEIFKGSFLVSSYLVLFAAIGLSCAGFWLNFVEVLLPNLYFASALVSVFMLAMLVVQNFEVISTNWYNVSKSRNWTHVSCRVILLLSVCILFSNSFIVEEAKTLMFLLISVVVILVFDVSKSSAFGRIEKAAVSFRKSMKAKAVLLAIVICFLIRVSINYLRCRDEQEWCKSATHNIWKSGGYASKVEWLLTLFSLAILVTFSRIWLRSCGNLVGHSPTVFLARYSPTVLVVCIGGYWVLHRLPKDVKTNLLGPWQADMLAWIVYACVSLGILCAVLKPLCIYILPRNNALNAQRDNIIPQLFRQVRGMFSEKGGQHDDIPIVCGLATAYSAVYVIVGVYLTLLFALLLGDAAAPSAVLMFFCAALVLVISSLSRYEKAKNIEEVFDVPSSSLLAWVMMSFYFFYATGHQPTFPNIAWEAAFVGTGGQFAYNFIPATLIMLNTFGSHILFGVTLPLLLIAPFSFFAIMQSWIKKNDPQKDFSRGDVLIYEHESLVVNHAFTLSCKYILCYGIRVFASMLTATIHCRHLMVWAIFAPKLIFESIGFVVTTVSVTAGYLILIRINYEVDKLVQRLNKQNR